MMIAIWGLSIACFVLCVWASMLLRQKAKAFIAQQNAESERDQTTLRFGRENSDLKTLLLETQNHASALQTALDSANLELAAKRDIIENLNAELRSALQQRDAVQQERDDAQRAEANMAAHLNAVQTALDSANLELTAKRDIIKKLDAELLSALQQRDAVQQERDDAQRIEANLVAQVNDAYFELAQKCALVSIIKEELKTEAGEHAEQRVLREYFESETSHLRSVLATLERDLARARSKARRSSIIEAFLSFLAGGGLAR
jgi:hypothetical protein